MNLLRLFKLTFSGAVGSCSGRLREVCGALSMLTLCVLTCISTAHAADHIIARAWVEDPTGLLGLTEVSRLPMHNFSGPLTRGFGRSVIWLRLRIDPDAHPRPQHTPDMLMLRIRPVYLDDIQVFDPLSEGGVPAAIGDRYHPRNSDFISTDFVLPIARGDVPRDLWLRLSSSSTRQIDVNALNPQDLSIVLHTQALVFSCYLGLITIMAIWAQTHWILNRDHLVGSFALAQWAALVFAVCSLGYGRLLWPGSWPAAYLDHLTSVFSAVSVSAAIVFHALFTREFKPPRGLLWAHGFMIALLPIKLAMMLGGYTMESLRLNMAEILWSPIVFLISVWLSPHRYDSERPRGTLPRGLVIAFYVFLVVTLAFASLPGLGMLSAGEISLYVVQVHGLITGALVLLLLQYRARLMQAHYQASLVELERARLKALHAEQVREDQDKLFCMLTHELKTPLATLQMRIDPGTPRGGELRRAIRDINAVIERCAQSNQFEHKQLVPRIAETDVVKVLRDCIDECPRTSTIRLDTPAALIMPTDRQFLSIVIDNLLENACKYAAPMTPVDVQLTPDPGSRGFRLEVSNMPGPAGQPVTDRVFEKYYRSPLAHRQTGTGLGLYIVKNLISVLGGQVQYIPKAKQVTFVCMLPGTS